MPDVDLRNLNPSLYITAKSVVDRLIDGHD